MYALHREEEKSKLFCSLTSLKRDRDDISGSCTKMMLMTQRLCNEIRRGYRKRDTVAVLLYMYALSSVFYAGFIHTFLPLMGVSTYSTLS